MANEKHLQKLKEGLIAWTLWRAGHNPWSAPTIDLSGANLRFAQLALVDLRWVNLNGADLNGANLSGANLHEANLHGAKIGRADLSLADLSGANLHEANLSGANLHGADLREAKLDGATLTDACLGNTKRAGWSIQGIICEGAFWGFYRQERTTYSLGEFERIHADKPVEQVLLQKKDNTLKKEFEYHVFICHSSKDKPIVEAIVQDFKREGITYWLDGERIRFGDWVIPKIEEGLQRSKYIMPCVSKNLKESGWTKAEYSSILNAELSGHSGRVVIPLKLNDFQDEDMPFLLGNKKYVSYINKIEFAEFLQFLKAQ